MTGSPRISKSDQTRAAILDAARQIFADLGYERATIREIAAAANIDPAMVIRYFHSKEELFAQVADLDLHLPDLTSIDRRLIGETLARHFLTLWEGASGNSGLSVLLRSAASNDFAGKKLRSVFASQVHPALAAVAGPLEPEQRSALVASQLLGMAYCRHVLKLQPVVELPAEVIIRQMGRTLQTYITGDS